MLGYVSGYGGDFTVKRLTCLMAVLDLLGGHPFAKNSLTVASWGRGLWLGEVGRGRHC